MGAEQTQSHERERRWEVLKHSGWEEHRWLEDNDAILARVKQNREHGLTALIIRMSYSTDRNGNAWYDILDKRDHRAVIVEGRCPTPDEARRLLDAKGQKADVTGTVSTLGNMIPLVSLDRMDDGGKLRP